MTLPSSLDFLRRTRWWQRISDRRYVRRHAARVEFYRTLLPARPLIFDVGANIGHYTLLFSHLGARVIAIEPQAELAAKLRQRFAGQPDVQVVATALGAAPSQGVLHKTADLSEVASLRADVTERSRFAAEHPFTLSETVPIDTLDALIARFGYPDFCKIDVEGFEREVLAGLTRPVPLCSFEFNREYWEVAAACLARLAELGDYRFNFALSNQTSLSLPTWTDAASVTREITRHSDPLLWGDIYARRASDA